jgi:hypothetical protein
MGCSPVAINTAAERAPDLRPSATTEIPCVAQQPDLTIGSIVFHKGKATINGSIPLDTAGPVRHGDRIVTAADGFVAIELLDGNLVNISPLSTVTAHCNTAAPGADNYAAENKPYRVTGAHMSGGIRG